MSSLKDFASEHLDLWVRANNAYSKLARKPPITSFEEACNDDWFWPMTDWTSKSYQDLALVEDTGKVFNVV